jgi:hypothetical protein
MLQYNQADWVIHYDKKDFYISEKQYQFMKLSSSKGQTIIWFDDLTISIPHISYMERIEREKNQYPTLPKLTEEIVDQEKVNDFRKKLHNTIKSIR